MKSGLKIYNDYIYLKVNWTGELELQQIKAFPTLTGCPKTLGSNNSNWVLFGS